MKKLRESPFVVGICNAVMPGLGYLLIDERVVFGWLLLVGSVLAIVLSFVEPSFLAHSFLASETAAGKALEVAWYASFLAAYGYDAYSLAKAKRTLTGTSAPDLHPMVTE